MLDTLRGVALFGIITANMILYSLYLYLDDAGRSALGMEGLNHLLDLGELVFVEGKFYTIFSMLFGLGFSILLGRAAAKGQVFPRFFLRRVAVLFLIGLSHAVLVWPDDILTFYAVGGAALLLFRRSSDRTILAAAGTALLLPIPIALAGGLPEAVFLAPRDALLGMGGASRETLVPAMATGGPREVVLINAGRWFGQVGYVLTSGMMFRILGNFLLGYYLGRKQVHRRLEEHRRTISRLALWGLVTGLPLSVVYALTIEDESLLYHVAALGLVPQGVAYACLVCLGWMNPAVQRRLRVFAPVGRMALTNYVGQSVICTWIFNGPGLGLGGTMGPAHYLPLGIAVYAVQIVASGWWLRRFAYGPLEWVWRALTYGTPPPLTRRTPG